MKHAVEGQGKVGEDADGGVEFTKGSGRKKHARKKKHRKMKGRK